MANIFCDKFDSRIEDEYVKATHVDDAPVLFAILDTAELIASLDDFALSDLQTEWIRKGQGFMLVYSIADAQTFRDAMVFREMILRSKRGKSPHFILVGNKCELTHKRRVTREQASSLASEWHCPLLCVVVCAL